MNVTVRAAGSDDEAFLREMQYLALFVPPGADPFPREVVDDPTIARYYAGFGTRPSDLGRIAELPAGTPIGAAWVRHSTAADPSYGYVDDDTPELGIAVVEEYRGSGVGASLLTALLAELPRCSLSVDCRNPAMRLYERHGFAEIRREGDSVFMLHVRPDPGAAATGR
jgi:ribosomal protein S18 acetylase RimI-like enzyme